jgi:hypothetical protein
MGWFLWDGQKLWEWRLDKAHNRLLQLHSAGMDIYTPLLVPRYANRPNCWTRLRVDQPETLSGNICLVDQVAPAVWKVYSTSEPTRPPPLPSTLKEMFSTWGC